MKKPRLKRGFLLSACYLPVGEPGPVGAIVEPLGEGLMSVLPDGFSPLFRPAAALPASLLMPVLGLVPVALPVVVPLVDGPVAAPLVAAPPAPELPPAEPLPDCANATVPVNASVVANPNAASFMTAPFLVALEANEVPPDRVPFCRSQILAVR
ncbi:hypothetical protein CQ14_22080 [Bradyrhizobium lablabi]|uniref:Uncharacterized protein n=1 Tax=Bradyrhizobium lablabi TaxID=722472 RepID=A0A0R3MLS1_9BRAD|nr:hypothetical protein [Bradyrhizobium lablabi]KRR21159.1 hypothetical protein CQ14_22080 [Bradyrhizobium lablabi]